VRDPIHIGARSFGDEADRRELAAGCDRIALALGLARPRSHQLTNQCVPLRYRLIDGHLRGPGPGLVIACLDLSGARRREGALCCRELPLDQAIAEARTVCSATCPVTWALMSRCS
jgi:hypothetical protein